MQDNIPNLYNRGRSRFAARVGRPTNAAVQSGRKSAIIYSNSAGKTGVAARAEVDPRSLARLQRSQSMAGASQAAIVRKFMVQTFMTLLV